jgi:hypothetical protein
LLEQKSLLPRPLTIWLSVGLMLAPIVFFYRALLTEAVNIPYQDDYDSVLDFLNSLTQMSGLRPRIIQTLSAQHNEYKLIFENIAFTAQYYIFGHTNFVVLIGFGSLFVLLSFLVVLRMACADDQNFEELLPVLVPCAYLLFQLQYASALDWSMTSLQNMPAIFFVLLSISLLSRDTARTFYAACISLVLAISASGNGFFLVPVGALLLLQNKRYKQLALWSLLTASCLAAYFWRYNLHTSQTHGGESVLQSTHNLNFFYAMSFLGASGAGVSSYKPSVFLGITLLCLFGHAIRKKYYQTNPAIFYSMLFILITSLGVAFLRGDYGVLQSLASHYRIYSNLFLVLAYIYLAHMTSKAQFSKRIKLVAFVAVFLIAIGFNVVSNRTGYKFLHVRRSELIEAMTIWEKPDTALPPTDETGELSEVIKRHKAHNIFKPNDDVLRESIRLGIYSPPAY